MRTPSCEMKCLKKGAWSLEEDQMLVSYISRYGIWNWSHMPKFAGLSRSGKSCRLRWMNYLKPNLKRGSFSKEEEETILHFHSILGNKWSAIAAKIPGRSDNEVKNYWHTHLKKQVTNMPLPKNPQQKDMNKSLEFEGHNAPKIKEPANHGDDIMDFLLSSNTDTSKDHGIDFVADYHDMGSPGTVEDLQYFWKQLSSLENMESGNIQWDMFFDPTFLEYSYKDQSVHSVVSSETVKGQ